MLNCFDDDAKLRRNYITPSAQKITFVLPESSVVTVVSADREECLTKKE